jgi:hypothetical protein
MKKIYWIIPLFLIIIAGIIIGIMVIGLQNKPVKDVIKDNSIKSDNTNLCQEVISISEVKNTCNTGIKEDTNGSYYITPNNTTIDSVGSQAELSVGEISRCFKKIITNDYEQFTPAKGSELNIMISTLNSTDSANKFYEETVPSFNESNSWEKASKNALVSSENTSEFGTRGNFATFKAMDAIIPEDNMTTHLSKVVGISFLKGNKVIWLQSAAYNQSTPLLCELENLKQIARIIDKKIK